MNNAVNILQEGSMMKSLTKLGIPIVIAMLIMAIYNVVDTFWVARLGTLPVAAVSVVFPLSLVFLGIGLMFGVGGGVYISRLLGAKQIVKAGQVASVSVITSVILAALIALVCNAFLPEILLFMGANEEMMSLAEAYGRLFIVSCVIGTLNVSMSNIIVSQGASKTSASAMIIGSVVNVALDPLFIYAFGWGVEGAAWASPVKQEKIKALRANSFNGSFAGSFSSSSCLSSALLMCIRLEGGFFSYSNSSKGLARIISWSTARYISLFSQQRQWLVCDAPKFLYRFR